MIFVVRTCCMKPEVQVVLFIERKSFHAIPRNCKCRKGGCSESRYEYSRGSYEVGNDSSAVSRPRVLDLLYLRHRARKDPSLFKGTLYSCTTPGCTLNIPPGRFTCCAAEARAVGYSPADSGPDQ